MDKVVFVVILFISVWSLAAEEKIPMVGLDKDGSPIEIFVGKKSLQDQLKKSIDSVQDTTLHVLESKKNEKGWSLRTVVVGISMDIQAGIEGIITLDVVPRFRVLFSNEQDAVIP